MTRRIYAFETPESFLAGAIGEPGRRAFYLQARQGGKVVSVGLEKVQVAVLAERLLALVDEMRRRGLDVASGPGPAESTSLEEPLVEAFRAGTLSLTWDGEHAAVVIEASAGGDEEDEDVEDDEDAVDDDEDAVEDDEEAEIRTWADDDPAGPDLLRVMLPAGAVEAFATRAGELVSAGRPLCPMCGQPLDPQGHLCPRRNGHASLLH